MGEDWTPPVTQPERLARVETKIDGMGEKLDMILDLHKSEVNRLDLLHQTVFRQGVAIEQLQRNVDGTPGKPDGILYDVDQLKASRHSALGVWSTVKILVGSGIGAGFLEYLKNIFTTGKH